MLLIFNIITLFASIILFGCAFYVAFLVLLYRVAGESDTQFLEYLTVDFA